MRCDALIEQIDDFPLFCLLGKPADQCQRGQQIGLKFGQDGFEVAEEYSRKLKEINDRCMIVQ